MSYEHRGLVIGVKQKLLYFLPIFSYDPHKYPDFYHDFRQNLQAAASLSEQLKETMENKTALEAENEQLKAELKSLL